MKEKNLLFIFLLVFLGQLSFSLNLAVGYYTGVILTDTSLTYEVWADDVPEQMPRTGSSYSNSMRMNLQGRLAYWR